VLNDSMRSVLVNIGAALASAALLLSAGCGDNPPVNYPTVAPQETTEATLGPGDVIEVVIYYGNHESKAQYRIGPTGEISVQFIGTVQAGGMLPAVLEAEVRKRLADGYLRDPIVALGVVESNSRRLSMFGQIQKAGTIRFVPGMTIVEAIAQSGGFTPMARKNAVQVTRMVDGKKTTYTVPVQLIGEGRRPNFPMVAGDVVFVPERIF
jgi:polysaccharide export outer membrane protein